MHVPFSGKYSRPHHSIIATVLSFNNLLFFAGPPILRVSSGRSAREEWFQRSIVGEVFAKFVFKHFESNHVEI